MNDNIAAAASKTTARNEELQQIFMDVYALEDANEKYKALQIVAVDCAQRLFNVLLSLRKPDYGLHHRAVLDLAVGLNGNAFWQQHGMVLMPLLHTAIQAQTDYISLAVEKQSNPTTTAHDKLYAESELVGLELFAMIAFLLGGSDLMAIRSLQIKRRLSPYLMA